MIKSLNSKYVLRLKLQKTINEKQLYGSQIQNLI